MHSAPIRKPLPLYRLVLVIAVLVGFAGFKLYKDYETTGTFSGATIFASMMTGGVSVVIAAVVWSGVNKTRRDQAAKAMAEAKTV